MLRLMLFKTLVILTVFEVTFCENEICSTPLHEACSFSERMPTDYPETAEELKRDCNNVREFMRCFIHYHGECPSPGEVTPQTAVFLRYLEEQCQEDSEAFQVISRNIDCFTPTMRLLDEECSPRFLNRNDVENLRDNYEKLFGGYVYVCLNSVWRMTCKARNMGERCGSELTEVLSDILKNTDYSYVHYCETDNLLEVLSFNQDIERMFDEGTWIKNYEEFKNGRRDEENDIDEEK